jgi:hypothetical protein
MPYHRRSLILTAVMLPDLTSLVKSGQELERGAAPKKSGTTSFGSPDESLQACNAADYMLATQQHDAPD